METNTGKPDLPEAPRRERRQVDAEPPYFGGCPECGQTDGYLNAGSAHFFICVAHQTYWCAGWNLFSLADDETEDTQRRVWEATITDDWRKVEPVRWSS